MLRDGFNLSDDKRMTPVNLSSQSFAATVGCFAELVCIMSTLTER